MICNECGKKLGMLEGYAHPTLGKKVALCSPCFTEVDSSVSNWREFVKENSFRSGDKNEIKINLTELNSLKYTLRVPVTNKI